MEYDVILLENGAKYLAETELNDLTNKLKKSNIELKTMRIDGPKNSLNDISIFIGGHITELIITGLLIPTAYDVLKSSLKFIVYKIKENVKIIQSGKVREAQPCIQFKTCNGEIIAPIPQNLSESQFDKYMDGVWQAVHAIKPNPEKKYESFIIEQNEDSLHIEAKTMLQYAQEQYNKQEQRKSNSANIKVRNNYSK